MKNIYQRAVIFKYLYIFQYIVICYISSTSNNYFKYLRFICTVSQHELNTQRVKYILYQSIIYLWIY